MALGRSNSLSINTGATNSLFGQQQQNNPSTQPAAAGGLFGASTQQATQAGSLFGGPAAQQQQTGGGSSLFGSNTSQPQQSGGLFGSTATSQPQQTNSLFGNTQASAPATQQSGGGLFGSSQLQPNQQQSTSLFGNMQSTAQGTQQSGGGLFGSSLSQPNQQQPQQQSTSLFGNLQNKPATGLFGSSTAQGQGQTSGSSLFGTSSLFGGNNTQQQQQNQPSMFGAQNQQQQQQAPSNSVFGLSAAPPHALPSLLGASQYRSNQYQPFAGKLTMGQGASATAPQQQTQGAVKINFDEMRSTTRFVDCVDDVKTQLENIDKMIQSQERFCRDIEAFLPKHGQNVVSLTPDVELIKEKADVTGTSLSLDAGGIDAQQRVLNNDSKDFQRCERVVTNLAQPLQYRYTGYSGTQSSAGPDGDLTKDMDLVGNYFAPMAADLSRTLDSYASNLAEIEGHMRVIEHSAVAQAQQLASKRAGVGSSGQANGEETVRELADTLRSFEASILGAASLVGQCREGVNDLVLGKLSNGVGRR